MSRQPRRPYRVALWLVPILVWMAGGAAIYAGIRLFRTPPADLDALLPEEARVTDRTVLEERRWIGETVKETYLASPPGPLPCAWALATVGPEMRGSVVRAIENEDLQALTDLHSQNTSEWLPGLALAQLLVRKGKLRDAEQIIRDVARRKVLPVYPDDSTPDEQVLGRIHQMHLLGYVWIERNYNGDDLWVALKNPIGFSKIIARRRQTYVGEVPTWVELKLPPPGCSTPADFLTTYDLYNNLIVGYLQTRTFHETDKDKLEAEFRRSYNDSAEENPLFAIVRAVKKDWKPGRESWAWALSNAERLMRERLVEGEGYPEDARLGLNLSQLMESAWEVAPVEARKSLGEQSDALIEIARKRRSDIAASEIDDFDRSLARLILFRASRTGAPPELLEAVRQHLEPGQQALVEHLTATLQHRQKPSEWAAVVTGEKDSPDLTEALGSHFGAWRSASRQDLAASVAHLGLATDSLEVRRDRARKAESLLDLKDGRPAELGALEKDLGFFWRFEPKQLLDSARGAALVGGVSGLVLAVFAYWVCLQLRLRKELFTSFYRAEVEQRLRS